MKRLLILAILTLGICRSVVAQTTVGDDFNRPNSTSIGSSFWNTPYANPINGSNGGIQVVSDGYTSLDAHAGLTSTTTLLGGPFGNDQWAQAKISAIAASTSVVAITAASQSGSNTTYTYTLSSGSALIMNQQIYVAGMAHGGNNSTVGFNITGLGAGTFTVVNASGVTATESGTGTSPSDSYAGLIVRGSTDGKTGYVCFVGTNSGQVGGGGVSSDQRVYQVEIWKVVSGVQTVLTTIGLLTSVPDSVGDIYTFTVSGTRLNLFKNGNLSITTTDSSIASGSPGILAGSISGASEWENPTGYSDVGATGNSGTQFTNFQGGDYTATNVPDVDPFVSGAVDLHTYNANWVENTGTFQIVASPANSATYNTVVAGNALASWQGATFSNDQWAEVSVVFNTNSFLGPAVRVSASGLTGAYFYRQNTANDRVLFKIVSGSFTLLATSNTSHTNVTGDRLRLVVIGTNLYCFLNGALENFGVISDNSVASGFPGMEGAQNAGATGTVTHLFRAGNAEIGGTVGVAGATITLGGAGSGSTTTAANGTYSFTSGLADGTYTVTPSLAGHTFVPSSLSVVISGASIFPIGENTSQSGTSFNGTILMQGASITPGASIR